MSSCPDSCSGSTFLLDMCHWTNCLHFSLLICQMGTIIISTSQNCHEKWVGLYKVCAGLVAQSCPTLCDPMDCSAPLSSVHGLLQARILGVGCHFLLQGIFPTQGSNTSLLRLLHCRWILYHWTTRDALYINYLVLEQSWVHSVSYIIASQKKVTFLVFRVRSIQWGSEMQSQWDYSTIFVQQIYRESKGYLIIKEPEERR